MYNDIIYMAPPCVLYDLFKIFKFKLMKDLCMIKIITISTKSKNKNTSYFYIISHVKYNLLCEIFITGTIIQFYFYFYEKKK